MCRPVEDIIKNILRDVGLASLPGIRSWKSRTPEDIEQPGARAAPPSRPRQPGAEQHLPTSPPPADPDATGNPPLNPLPPEPAAIPHADPVPAHTGSGLPDDPAEAVAMVLSHFRIRGHWRPPPGV